MTRSADTAARTAAETASGTTGERGPSVVVVGGGHGAAAALRAVRRFSGDVTAVISVADDGGSSGRLREILDVVALGDIRKCLVALADPDAPLGAAFEHRFAAGELDGHALGNLVLAALAETCGDLVQGIDAAGSLLGACGRVLPATTERVVLRAVSDTGAVDGQVAVAAAGRVRQVSLVPQDARPPAEAVAAIMQADLVILGPGSLYTSVLAAVAVPGIAEAVACTPALRVHVCNLRAEVPETEGYDVAAHVDALRRHGVVVDVVLRDGSGAMAVGRPDGTRVVGRDLAGSNGLVHDPGKLAVALADLLA